MADEGEQVEAGWPHTEDDLITGVPALQHVESNFSGLTGSMATLQGRLSSQSDEIKAIQEDLAFYRSWLLALWVLVAGLSFAVITLAVLYAG